MGKPAKQPATYDDVLNAPEHKVAATALIEEIGPPFKRGRGGPGGWIILIEPELHLGPDVLVPDIAGWRRETMSTVTKYPAYFTVRPDWVCEVLSPSTERIDRGAKIALYAAAGV